MFLSRLKDENTNKEAANESKNNLGSSFPLMMIKASVTNLLHTLIMKRNKRINGNK